MLGVFSIISQWSHEPDLQGRWRCTKCQQTTITGKEHNEQSCLTKWMTVFNFYYYLTMEVWASLATRQRFEDTIPIKIVVNDVGAALFPTQSIHHPWLWHYEDQGDCQFFVCCYETQANDQYGLTAGASVPDRHVSCTSFVCDQTSAEAGKVDWSYFDLYYVGFRCDFAHPHTFSFSRPTWLLVSTDTLP